MCSAVHSKHTASSGSGIWWYVLEVNRAILRDGRQTDG